MVTKDFSHKDRKSLTKARMRKIIEDLHKTKNVCVDFCCELI